MSSPRNTATQLQRLVRVTKLDEKLERKLLDKAVLSSSRLEGMREGKNKAQLTKHIFLDVLHRGPEALARLKEALLESGNLEAGKILHEANPLHLLESLDAGLSSTDPGYLRTSLPEGGSPFMRVNSPRSVLRSGDLFYHTDHPGKSMRTSLPSRTSEPFLRFNDPVDPFSSLQGRTDSFSIEGRTLFHLEDEVEGREKQSSTGLHNIRGLKLETERTSKVWNEPSYSSSETQTPTEPMQIPSIPYDMNPYLSPTASPDRLALSPPYIRESMEPIKVHVRPSKMYRGPPQHRAYPIFNRVRGNTLIIDNEKFVNNIFPRRCGSKVDSSNLKSLFTQLGFTVTLLRNLPYQEMLRQVRQFSQLDSHPASDMCVVCVLSHGHQGAVAAADGREMETELILRQFNNDCCPGLKGKPKFFIIQACRGEDTDYGIECESYEEGYDSTDAVSMGSGNAMPFSGRKRSHMKDPTWEDMLITYSTVPGYVANRDQYRGTWFIECLCQVFMDQAADTDIREMLDCVACRLRWYESEFGSKQSFSYEVRHFYNKLFFNPGIFMETQVQLREVVMRRRAYSESDHLVSDAGHPGHQHSDYHYEAHIN